LSNDILRSSSVTTFSSNPTMRHHFFASLAVLSVELWAAAHAAGLNDTGISNCYVNSGVDNTGVEADGGSHPRQDCRYGRDAALGVPKVGGGGKGFDFTKIANNGTVLPESAALGVGATDWACTRDNVTGLVWEVKVINGLRSLNHAYTWYNSDATTNGGDAGIESNGSCLFTGRCDTEKFVADVNAGIGMCGAKDWRMPSQNELLSIMDFGRTAPSIDPTYFPNTPSSYFWSASAVASLSNHAWRVGFDYGTVEVFYKKYGNQVRLVRVGQ